MEISAIRSFNWLYIYLDIIWLIVFCSLLWVFNQRKAFFIGLAAGVIYFIVDYGVFYRALNTRVVTGADPFWLLLWLSFSYGITNFAWIWILLDRDKFAIEWSVLIISGWISVALLSQNLGKNFPALMTARGTDTYHGVMALILFAGYLTIIIHNLRANPEKRIAILPLLAIGIGMQFSWEAVLLFTGIRPADPFPLIVNSLIETNLGMPYAYFIHRALKNRKGSA